MRLLPAIAASILTVSCLAGCSSATDVQARESQNAGEGAGAGVELAPEDLKIAYFSAAKNNSYLQAGIAGVERATEEIGADVDVFDAKFDAQEQVNQIQSALTSGKYNSFVIEAVDGNLLCDILTTEAPKQNVLVSVINQPLCGRATNSGDELWEPSTVSFIGGQQRELYDAWIEQIVADNPDGGNVAIISGPSLSANTINLNEALKVMTDANFTVVANQQTDYSTPQAFDAAQTILQANPDVDIILSPYSGMSQGIVEAAKAKNRLGDLKLYDLGGDQWALDAVRSGDIAETVILLPELEGYTGVKVLSDAVLGEDIPRYINLSESESLPGGSPFVDSENVDEFTAEY